jgi:tRNA-dihydrouridine synthase B
VDVLVQKAVAAADKLGLRHIAVCGGVAANSALRAGFAVHGPKNTKSHGLSSVVYRQRGDDRGGRILQIPSGRAKNGTGTPFGGFNPRHRKLGVTRCPTGWRWSSVPENLNPRIGSVQLDNPFVLAPMAGIGDPPYRRLCRRGGAGMVCAEMVSANALHYKDERSQRMLATFPDEHPISMQVFGNDPDRLAGAAQAAEAAGADVVDLNCGCPVPKITKSGGGIALMKDEALFSRCVEAMVRAVRVPLTVKMRLGFRRGENFAVRFAKIAQDQGAAAVSVHARAQEDRHDGPPDLEGLGRVVQAVDIPVFGNGGVQTYENVRAMMETSGVAGVLVGQAAIGNPSCF